MPAAWYVYRITWRRSFRFHPVEDTLSIIILETMADRTHLCIEGANAAAYEAQARKKTERNNMVNSIKLLRTEDN